MMQALPAVIRDNLSGILQFVTTGLVVWVWWSLRRIFVTRAGFDAYKASVNARLEAIEERQYNFTSALQKIDSKLDALPTSDEVQRLVVALKESEGDLKGIKAQVEGLSHATLRLERAMDMFTEVHMREN